jgi:hypothetical protein
MNVVVGMAHKSLGDEALQHVRQESEAADAVVRVRLQGKVETRRSGDETDPARGENAGDLTAGAPWLRKVLQSLGHDDDIDALRGKRDTGRLAHEMQDRDAGRSTERKKILVHVEVKRREARPSSKGKEHAAVPAPKIEDAEDRHAA